MNCIVSSNLVGIRNALVACDFNVVVWHPPKPAFDMFAEHKCDVLFIEQERSDRAVEKCSQKYGFKVVAMKLDAGDSTVFAKAQEKPEYKADLVFVGHYQPGVHDPIVKLCTEGPFSIKVFGTGNWPVPQFLGSLPQSEVAHAYASALICPHVLDGNEERQHNVRLAGTVCVLLPQDGDVAAYVKNALSRVEAQPGSVTYFDRLHHAFCSLGLESSAVRCLNAAKSFR